MKRSAAAISTSLALIALCAVPAAAANAATDDFASTAQTATAEVTKHSFTSQSCLDQIAAIAAQTGVYDKEDAALCSGEIVVTESAPQIATVAEVQKYASTEKLSEAESLRLVQAAASGAVSSRSWTHAYWGGSMYEVHAGKTFWNGTYAWIAKYSAYTGSHKCHTEGSWAAGWVITSLGCSKPSAGSSADAFYRFDASILVKGSPITLGVGLHYSTSKTGAVSTWQVGG